ncbi:hypothetical protein ACE09S_005196 [Salmonella enterica]
MQFVLQFISGRFQVCGALAAGFQIRFSVSQLFSQFFFLVVLAGNQFLGEIEQALFVPLSGDFNKGGSGILRQLAELAQLAIANTHTGHGLERFFAESAEVLNIQVNLIF